jgi:hypothetical protein
VSIVEQRVLAAYMAAWHTTESGSFDREGPRARLKSWWSECSGRMFPTSQQPATAPTDNQCNMVA